MNRIIPLFLGAVLLLGLIGCGNSASDETLSDAQSAVFETTAPVETTIPATTEATEPPLTGHIFLTVSSLDFSLVGETEDIYVGTAPREEILWNSADEAVITVDNGVLTAVGVGTTTVSATYGDQYWECSVSCLAETEEDLFSLGYGVLRQPKRMPPVFDDAEITYFEDAAIVGDSITYVMHQYEAKNDLLGDTTFLARGGCSVIGFLTKSKLLYYQGVPTPLEDALALSGVNKAFIMLGQNDLRQFSVDENLTNYATLIERIREQSPDLDIYVQSCTPEWRSNGSRNVQNEKIYEFNEKLKVFCEENDITYIDIVPYIIDHTDMMSSEYNNGDEIHINGDGCDSWMRALRAFAMLETLKGEE